MKPTLPSSGHSKFVGKVRYYHRSKPQARRTWDEWVEGPSTKVRRSRKWLEIIVIIVGVLALAGIITGLVIELS